jgi:exodeoxyribonuclease V alpha subunit
MVDTELFHAIITAIPDKARIVLLGDADQLESVGSGAVLEELISIRDIPLYRLTEVVRQSQNSRIIQTAHSIISGEEPDLTKKRWRLLFY